jgi:predicted transcriptional regulator of viral defense system
MVYTDKFKSALGKYANYEKVLRRVFVEVVVIFGVHYALYREFMGAKAIGYTLITVEGAQLAVEVMSE